MDKLISLVVRDAHVKAFASVADDAVTSPHRTLPLRVTKVGSTSILLTPFSLITKLLLYGLLYNVAPGLVAPSAVEKSIWLSPPPFTAIVLHVTPLVTANVLTLQMPVTLIVAASIP